MPHVRYAHWVVIPVAMLSVLFCAGGALAADNEHTTRVGMSTAVGYAFVVAFAGAAALLFIGAVLFTNFEERGAVILAALVAVAVVVGDVWGVLRSVVVLSGGQRPWYEVWLPLSVALLCWWVTLSLGSVLARAFVKHRRAI
jgi:hypothetical protein